MSFFRLVEAIPPTAPAPCSGCGFPSTTAPDIARRECGPDCCGATCGPGCGAADETCSEMTWQCVTVGEFATIGPGTFEMGSPDSEAGRIEGEDQHTVTLTGSLAMLSIEVTQGRFESLMGYNQSDNPDCGPAVENR